MANFTKNQTPSQILNKAVRGLVTTSGVFAPGIPTSGRLNSVGFDQRTVIGGSGVAVTDKNGMQFYDDAGLYGLSDYYPLNVLATGTLQLQTIDYSQIGPVSVVSPAGDLFLELPPNSFSNRPRDNVASKYVTATGTYGMYIGLTGRSSSNYEVQAQILGSTADAGTNILSNLSITGPSTAVSGVAYTYTLGNDGATPDSYQWSSTSSGVSITNATNQSTPITFVTVGSSTLSGQLEAAAAINSPQSVTQTITTNNPAFGVAAVDGPSTVASGVANTYTLQLDMGTVPASTVSYNWTSTDPAAVYGAQTASGTTITFPASGTYDVYCTATSASADPTAVSGTIQPTASGYIPPLVTFGSANVTGPGTLASGVDGAFTVAYTGNLPAVLANYQWATFTSNSVVTSGNSQTAYIRFDETGNQQVIATLTSNFASDSPVSDTGSVTVTNPSAYTEFAVTVQYYSDYYTAGNKYYIDGSRQLTVTLEEGKTYRFNQADSSNSNHPLRFSTTSNGTHSGGTEYTTGVTTNGTPGQVDAYTEITVAAGSPTLYYYCTNHSNMGGQANTP